MPTARRCRMSGEELTITGYDKKLIIVRELMCNHVWISRNDLQLGRQAGTLLEFEVTNRPREGKVAVDSAKVDEATGRSNPCLFACSKVSHV